MKKEELIKKLQELPDGVDICILDHKRWCVEDNGDGTSAGFYPHFEVRMMDDDSLTGGSKAFAVMSFDNPYIDLEDEGL